MVDLNLENVVRKIEVLVNVPVFTNAYIAKKIGISPTMIGKYRSGQTDIKQMSISNADKLLKFYDDNWKLNQVSEIIVDVSQPGEAYGVVEIIGMGFHGANGEIDFGELESRFFGAHYSTEGSAYQEIIKNEILETLYLSDDVNIRFEFY